MTARTSPALEQFAAALGDEFVLAQVLIRRWGRGYELRHINDRSKPETELRDVPPTGLRELAQFTVSGAFRPLKSAPNLRSGWRTCAVTEAELGASLDQLYPGAVADWFAVRSGSAPVTDYRPFTARQTGMYRVTTMLSDKQAGHVTRACCDARFCLKQRLWTVPGLAPDPVADKSAIPCLEPCALLLEFARKAMRIEQEEKIQTALAPSDWETARAILENARSDSAPEIREADFSAPGNPRRVQLLLEKLKSFPANSGPPTDPDEK